VTENELLALTLASANRLKRFALHLCGGDDGAEDLVQEGFVRALAHRGELRDPSKAVPWLMQIVRSVFLDKYRRTRNQRQLLEAEADCSEPQVGNLEDEILRAGMRDEVLAALAALPDDWRISLVLCDVDELSYDEIAQVFDCPVGTVRSRIARARGRMFASLQGHATELGLGKGARR